MSQTTAGRKLGRKQGHRKSMLRNLATDLLLHETVRTTVPKAREVRRLAEHLIASSRAGDLNARRRVARDVKNPQVFQKLFGPLRARYESRNGGYVRIFALGTRAGDNAPMAIIKLVS